MQIRKNEEIVIGTLSSILLNEIENIYKPLFDYIEQKNYEIAQDNFNRIRILMPLIELSSKIEFQGQLPLLLKELKVPKPDIVHQMFRHGLSHHIRPFYIIKDGVRINWAIPQSPCNHWETSNSVGIYAPKLLKDLEDYLKKFLGNNNKIKIQTGIELI